MKFDSKKITTHIIFLVATIALIVYFLPRDKEQSLSYEENRPWNHGMLRAPFEIYIYPDTAEVIDSLNKVFTPICDRNEKLGDSILAKVAKNNFVYNKIASTIRDQYGKGVVTADMYADIEKDSLPVVRVLDGKYLKRETTESFVSPRVLYLMIDSLAKTQCRAIL